VVYAPETTPTVSGALLLADDVFDLVGAVVGWVFVDAGVLPLLATLEVYQRAWTTDDLSLLPESEVYAGPALVSPMGGMDVDALLADVFVEHW